MTTNGNGQSRRHVDLDLLTEAIKQNDRRVRRREQFRQASRRKREKKRQALAQSSQAPRSVLEQLSSGDFPHSQPVESMGRLGLTNKEIADVLGVAKSTLDRWVRLSPSLRAALLRGRRVADTHVADSVYKQALGFMHPEEKIFYDSKRGKVVRTDTNRYYPPNVIAAIFWLKNRYAEFWRDHKGEEQSPLGGNVAIQQVKFVLVQSSGSPSLSNKGNDTEKVIDGDYQILQSAGEKSSPATDES